MLCYILPISVDEIFCLATPFWYNAILTLIQPLYQWRIKKRALNMADYQQECLERFGPFQPAKNLNTLWFHCVSVGETNAAQPLIEHYLKLGHAVLVTNTTKTGQARAKSLFLKAPYEALFQAVYLPADKKGLVADFYKKYQPQLLILVETELWPNLIDQANRFKVPCLLINARLSEKSATGYAKVQGLTKQMLQGLHKLLAQDDATLKRYVALGMMAQKAQVVGNIKFDIHAPVQFVAQAQQLKRDWGLSGRKIVTLASTHAPEEQDLLQQLQPYLKQDSHLLCVIVPRHPERFDEVFQQIQALDLKVQRRSLGQVIHADTQVYLADSMGELWLWYALSQSCYVGGSLNEPGGGHNILEPMALNIPTVIGKNYFNFQTIVDEFVSNDAILIARDAKEAIQQLIQCLEQSANVSQMNQQAQQVLERNQGSLQKHIQVIDRYLA